VSEREREIMQRSGMNAAASERERERVSGTERRRVERERGKREREHVKEYDGKRT
jgi:hypothetical protein